jgi:exopolysaccharide production protein ExoY
MSISDNSPNMTSSSQGFFAIGQAAGISGPFTIAGAGEPLIEVPVDKAFVTGAAVPPAARQQPLGGMVKRLTDILVATLALILAAPIMLVIAAFILAVDGGPVIFAHRRIGFAGRPFNCYKFRTMRRDASEVLQQYLADNPDAARECREANMLKHDPRITLFGNLL